MKLIDRNEYVIVMLKEPEIQMFNSERNVRLPYDQVSFAFTKMSGALLRVIPNKIRREMCVEDLANFARTLASDEMGVSFGG